ncbi:MAG: TolC family protein [Bacteroidales bacterium]|nr:TolC family protein [Bacteroidales bacterium]MBN2699125.1 TolC family protein [Bacteroidales bacterium]
MKRLVFSVLCSAILISNNAISAQQESIDRVLTLDEVIEIAKEQSLMALMARHSFRSSYWEYRTHVASFRPGLVMNATLPSLNNSRQLVEQPDGSERFETKSNMRTSVNMRMTQNVGLTGGNVFISTSMQRIDNFNADPGVTPPVSYLAYPVTIGFEQPINGYNPFKWEKKIEPLKFEEAKLAYINTIEQVNQRAVNYFFDLALAQINLEIALKNYANTDTLFQIARGRYQLGTIAENELLQMELSYLNAGTALNEATIDLQLRQSRLRSFLGFNEKVNIQLILPRLIPDIELSYDEALARAKANNPDVIEFQRRLLEAEQSVAQAKAQKGLNADLYAELGLSQFAEQFRSAYQNPENSQMVSVGLRVPIVDWGLGKGRYRMAQSAEEVIKTDVAQSIIDFDENVFLQVMQFNLQDDQVEIAAKADTIADLRYEVTKQRFLIGKIDVLDLNVALEEKDVARRGFVQSLRNYWDYYYNLRRLTLYDWESGRKLNEDFDVLLLQ